MVESVLGAKGFIAQRAGERLGVHVQLYVFHQLDAFPELPTAADESRVFLVLLPDVEHERLQGIGNMTTVLAANRYHRPDQFVLLFPLLWRLCFPELFAGRPFPGWFLGV